jgi:aspartyl-tRNA(Asn)/glutamyl-tRNA(Gln) amidotransferase subunit A
LTRFTAPFNLVGLPAITLPCGFDRDGLPVGVQLVAGRWNEAALLRAAQEFEREAGWATNLPPGAH